MFSSSGANPVEKRYATGLVSKSPSTIAVSKSERRMVEKN
jgi:hypothetical protein